MCGEETFTVVVKPLNSWYTVHTLMQHICALGMVSVVQSNMFRKIKLHSINNAVEKAQSFQCSMKTEEKNILFTISNRILHSKIRWKYLATKKIVTIILSIYFVCKTQKPRNETIKCSLANAKRISFCDMHFCVPISQQSSIWNFRLFGPYFFSFHFIVDFFWLVCCLRQNELNKQNKHISIEGIK